MWFLGRRWFVATLALAGCTPANLVRLEPPDEADRAEIVIFRESRFNASAMRAVFGADGNDYLILRDGEYSRLFVPPATYEFFIRSMQADKPELLPLTVQANDRLCLRVRANPDNYVKPLFFPAYFVDNAFLLEQADCPSEPELAAAYRWVASGNEDESPR